MRHLWKKLFNIKCLRPVQGMEDPGIQHEPPLIVLYGNCVATLRLCATSTARHAVNGSRADGRQRHNATVFFAVVDVLCTAHYIEVVLPVALAFPPPFFRPGGIRKGSGRGGAV